MVKTKLAILIASFAFSTAALAAPTVPKNMKSSPAPAYVPETGTTQNNVNPKDCPLLQAKNDDRSFNPGAISARVSGDLKIRTAESQAFKPSKQNTRR